MRSVTQLKSLGDLRTTISTHARSTPRQKGSTYLEVYLLDKEKQRLETELAMLTKRQLRIQGRLKEIREAMEWLMNNRQEGAPAHSPPAEASDGGRISVGFAPETQQLKKMTIEY